MGSRLPPARSDLYDDTTAVRVAILGAGLMGAQIGCEYALGSHDVVLHARDSVARLPQTYTRDSRSREDHTAGTFTDARRT